MTWYVAAAGVAGYAVGALVGWSLRSFRRKKTNMVTSRTNCSPSDIAFTIQDQAETVDRILVLIVDKDGVGKSMDNGISVTEAKQMAMGFHSWVDQCMGREIERK